jgi:hypothetical protein
LLLGGLGAAAWRKLRAERDDVARARVTGPTFGAQDAGAFAPTAVDSGALASADVASDMPRDALVIREDVAARAEDSAVDAGFDVAASQRADAAAQPVDAPEPPRDVLAATLATDASTPSGGGLATPVMSGATPRSHPRGRETIALEEALYDEVIACVRGRHRRRVRVVATYLGATGLADEIHVSSPYNEPETRPCIEAAVRRHPVGRFTDESWETGLVFDPDEE